MAIYMYHKNILKESGYTEKLKTKPNCQGGDRGEGSRSWIYDRTRLTWLYLVSPPAVPSHTTLKRRGSAQWPSGRGAQVQRFMSWLQFVPSYVRWKIVLVGSLAAPTLFSPRSLSTLQCCIDPFCRLLWVEGNGMLWGTVRRQRTDADGNSQAVTMFLGVYL